MGYTLRKSKIAMEQNGQSLTPLQPPIYIKLSSHVVENKLLDPGKRPAAFSINRIPLNIKRPRKHGLERDLHQLWEHFLGGI